jgi:hypothetical protein
MARWLDLPAGKMNPGETITLRDDLVAVILDRMEGEATVRIERIITLNEGGKSRRECVVPSMNFMQTEDRQWFRGEQTPEIYTRTAKPAPVDGRSRK